MKLHWNGCQYSRVNIDSGNGLVQTITLVNDDPETDYLTPLNLNELEIKSLKCVLLEQYVS